MRRKFLVVGSGVGVNISTPPFTFTDLMATDFPCRFHRALPSLCAPPARLIIRYFRYGLLRRKNKVFAGDGMVTVLVPLFKTGGNPQGDQLNFAILALCCKV